MYFPGLEKSWILGKMAEVMENFNFKFIIISIIIFTTFYLQTDPQIV